MADNAVSGTSGSLNENSFLQLLTTQMKYQDPMSPQDNTAFVAQLAQFTSLEQMTNVANTDQSVLQTLQSMQTMWQTMLAHQMIGSEVTVNDANGSPVSGTVQSVQIQNGQPQLVVSGRAYSMLNLVEMGPGSVGP